MDEKKNLTPEEIEKKKKSEELSDDMLDDVAAGGFFASISNWTENTAGSKRTYTP